MTQAVAQQCFRIETYFYKHKGKKKKKERLIFSDPNNEFLGTQVERYIKPAQTLPNQDGKISGIALVTKTQHIFSVMLKVLTLGYVCKSIAALLGGKKIYINLNSYNKWRSLNSEILLPLGIIKNASNRQVPNARKQEIASLQKLLLTPPEKRPVIEPNITQTKTAFATASRALKSADYKLKVLPRRCSDETYKMVRYQIAAYLILVWSRIDTTTFCTGPVLRTSPNVYTRNRSLTAAQKAKCPDLTQMTKGQRMLFKAEHPELMREFKHARIKKVKEERRPSTEITFNLSTDLFNSVYVQTDPLNAKTLLQELVRNDDGFYKQFSDAIVKPVTGFPAKFTNPKALALYEYIVKMGEALSQFNDQDPADVLFPIVEKISAELGRKNFFDIDSFEGDNVGSAICTLSALKLCLNAKILDDNYEKCIEFHHNDKTMKWSFPNKKYVDPVTNQAFSAPHVTALSGKLEGEKQLRSLASMDRTSADELFDCVRKIYEKKDYDRALINKILRELCLNPLAAQPQPEKAILDNLRNDYLAHQKEKPQPYYTSKANADEDEIAYFNHLVSLCDTIKKFGLLILRRYYNNGDLFGNQIYQSFDLTTKKLNIKITGTEPKISRTAEEHKAIIDKYFPGLKEAEKKLLDLPFRTKRPSFTDQRSIPKRNLNTLAPIQALFVIPKSHGFVGNCLTGAIAQSIFGKHYDEISDRWLGIDCSRDDKKIQMIRDATANYMIDHYEDFFDSIKTLLIEAKDSSLDIKSALEAFYRMDNEDEKIRAKLNKDEKISAKLTEDEKNKLKLKLKLNESEKNRLKLKIVREYAILVKEKNHWFDNACIYAFSCVIGRPFYIADSLAKKLTVPKQSKKLALPKYEIAMTGINKRLDAEPVYLLKTHEHYDPLFVRH